MWVLLLPQHLQLQLLPYHHDSDDGGDDDDSAPQQLLVFLRVELIDAEGNTLGALSAKAVVGEANSVVAQQDSKYKYPFQDPSLSREERVENLISLLTPEEKVGLMMNKSISLL